MENNSKISVSNCINSGLIKGTSRNISGIIGNIPNNGYKNVEVLNCVNTGVIIGGTGNNNYYGGIIGNIETGNNIITVSNCHYDKQMCIYGGINNADVAGQAVGYLTNEMTGTQLQSKLGTTNFTYSKSSCF